MLETICSKSKFTCLAMGDLPRPLFSPIARRPPTYDPQSTRLTSSAHRFIDTGVAVDPNENARRLCRHAQTPAPSFHFPFFLITSTMIHYPKTERCTDRPRMSGASANSSAGHLVVWAPRGVTYKAASLVVLGAERSQSPREISSRRKSGTKCRPFWSSVVDRLGSGDAAAEMAWGGACDELATSQLAIEA